jgi:hypothetical protein
MTSHPLDTFQTGSFHAAIVFLLILIAIVSPASAGTETAELLSDACIAEISAGTSDNCVAAYYRTPASAFIDTEPRWWGDMDGFEGDGTGCGFKPGFVVTNIPYTDFQYDSFKYSFQSQAEVDRFLKALPSLGGMPINVIGTDYIRSNPGAGIAFSGDGSGPKVREIIITTDRQIDGDFVRYHQGEVITQSVRFDLEFLPPYAISYKVQADNKNKDKRTYSLERSETFRNYNRYEWFHRNPRMEMIRNADGTYSIATIQDETYNFGAVFLESGATGDDPILSNSGRVVVPPNTAYLRNTIFNDIHIYSPVIGMSIGLAPQGLPVPSDEVNGDQTHYPDFNRYQELGILDIRNLNVSLKGGNNIYIYPNEELDICQ